MHRETKENPIESKEGKVKYDQKFECTLQTQIYQRKIDENLIYSIKAQASTNCRHRGKL